MGATQADITRSNTSASHCGPNDSSVTENPSRTACLFVFPNVTTPHSPIDNGSGEWPLIGGDVNYVARVIFIIIGGLEVCSGVIGNCLLLTVLLKRKSLRLRSVHNLFIANLAISDLVSLGYWMTFFVLDLILSYHPVASMTHCRVNGFLIGVFYLAGTLSLLSISFNRYLHVCHSHLYSRFFSLARTVTWCGLLYVTGVVFALPPFLGVGSYSYNKVTHFCSFSRTDPNRYAKVIVLLFSVVPWCFVGYWNFAIFRYWKRAKSSLKSNYPVLETSVQGDGQETKGNPSTRLKRLLSRKKSTTKEQLPEGNEIHPCSNTYPSGRGNVLTGQAQISGNPDALNAGLGADDHEPNAELETRADSFNTALSPKSVVKTKHCQNTKYCPTKKLAVEGQEIPGFGFDSADEFQDCPSVKLAVGSSEMTGSGFDSAEEFNPGVVLATVNSTGGCMHKRLTKHSSVVDTTVETNSNKFPKTEDEERDPAASQPLTGSLETSTADSERNLFPEELPASQKATSARGLLTCRDLRPKPHLVTSATMHQALLQS